MTLTAFRRLKSMRYENSPEGRSWSGMIQRCENPNRHNYRYYGGRGIKVCERWRNNFADFLSDMGRKPSPAHSIDRYPNNNGHYEPGNCRWATKSQQTQNSRRAKLVTLSRSRSKRVLRNKWPRVYWAPCHDRQRLFVDSRGKGFPFGRRVIWNSIEDALTSAESIAKKWGDNGVFKWRKGWAITEADFKLFSL